MDELIEHVRIHRQGGADELEVERIALAPPGPGEVRVRQQAVGVNFVDVYHRNGLYPLAQLPATLGVEGAGVVEALGPGVSGFAPGQRVAYTGLIGGYAAVRNVPLERLVAVPDDVDLDAIAGGLLRGLTAHMLFAHVRQLRPGDTVLVHAAAGGLGLVLTQWASALGARVIGTVGSRDKAALALAHGAERVVLYRDEDFVAAARDFGGGRGVDFAIDGIGGATLLRTFDAVRPYGMAASVGQAGGSIEPVDLMQIGRTRGIAFSRPSVMQFMTEPGLYHEGAQATLARLAAGLRVPVGLDLPLARAAEAHAAMEAGRTSGAVLLRPDTGRSKNA
ncbi:quinone oxidoreductase family protein [Massilia rhizosphaerae]|uniref:quinone oxidoreductase family protein n=1 Tax=Massilia rhizosphaerae TaxID=2784389 RepID=UPI0018DEB419|nr:quinone oxidoreductase [Massilia rhizosphaerae]